MYHEQVEICRFSEGFDDNFSRLCFIRRVFILLVLAFMMMFGQIMLVSLVHGVRPFLIEHFWLAFIGLTIFFSVCMLLSCSNIARSCFPWNFILFIVLIESLTLAQMVVAAKFSGGKVILLTHACMASVVLLMLIVALAVPVDFTKWTALFLLLFLIVFVFAIAALICIHSLKLPIIVIVYALIAVTILSFLMLLNLQILFNGEIFELYPDDFVLGAILMFADVIIFFMCCLKLIGFDSDEC